MTTLAHTGVDTGQLADARALTKRVARTFALATRLLPASVRSDVYLLYFVLRTLDDLVDAASPEALKALDRIENWALGGSGGSRETEILAHLAARHHDLPRDAVADFVLGMRTDLSGPTFVTEADVDLYAYRVAGTVGRLMAAILGSPAEADPAARALGVAMQRTNILRDIDEDLARGRVYLAAETLQRLGIQNLAEAQRRPLLEDQIRLTEDWYRLGIAGISQLRRGRRGVLAAALMYREILTQIGRDGFGRTRPWRSHVSRQRKVWLALRSLRA
ncbi:MAG: phytoene/squalene synthase family protein [Candidatus Dormibacteraeota bacterium]|nr:phytoene/squalene synthase family protein [Candidatus Dormibacteraeota bacterium]